MRAKQRTLPPGVAEFIQEVRNYPWFHPNNPDLDRVAKLVEEHQRALCFFGQAKIYSLTLIQDWKMAHIIAKDVVSGIPKYAKWNATRLQIMLNARIVLDDVARSQLLETTERLVKTAASEVVSEAIWEEVQERTLAVIREDLQDILLDASWAVAYDVARCAVWKIAEEQMKRQGYQNPFTPLMEIYKMGLWPMGLVRENGIFTAKRYFAVFCPKTREKIR